MSDDIPSVVQVRTGEDNRHRYRSIERAASFYGVNRSDSIAYACEDVVEIYDALQEVLDRDDLTRRQRREVAETFDAATRGVDVDVDPAECEVRPTR